MKRLNKYLVKSFLGPFLLTFSIAMIVLMLNFVWLYIDELVGKGLSWKIILQLMANLSARLIPTAIILGLLLASLMTFGKLGENYELAALKSSGISLLRIMSPVFVLALIIGISSFLFSNYSVPVFNYKFYSLLRDIKAQRPEFDIKEGQFYNGLEDYSLKIGRRSKDGMTLYDIMIYDHTRKTGNTSLIMADSGYMRATRDNENLVISLYSGSSYEELLSQNNDIRPGQPFRQVSFKKQEILLKLPGSDLKRTRQEFLKSNYQMLNMKQLRDSADAIRAEMIWLRNKVGHDLIETKYLLQENKQEARENTGYYKKPSKSSNPDEIINELPEKERLEVYQMALKNARNVQTDLDDSNKLVKDKTRWVNRYMNEWNKKLTNPIACVLFFLIGASLGAIIRKGGLGTPLVTAVTFFLIYYIINNTGEKYAVEAIIPPWAGIWGSTFLLIPLSIFLTFKSNSDSPILSSETYSLFFKKILFAGGSRESRNQSKGK